jgi:hypothetical protein
MGVQVRGDGEAFGSENSAAFSGITVNATILTNVSTL